MEVRLPNEMLGLPKDRGVAARKTNRLRLRAGRHEIPLLELWSGGFSVSQDADQPERGFVDIFDGERHLYHGLAYPVGLHDGIRVFAFKIAQDPRLGQPVDYARAENAPIALIPGRDPA